jgi:hypothetical protein
MGRLSYRVKCPACREIDPETNDYKYHYAWLTLWRPNKGLDSRLREFECKNCGQKQYWLLGESKIEEVRWSERRANNPNTCS